MSSNSFKSGLRRQTAVGVVRGVIYRPRDWVLLAARLECMLAAGSRPWNGSWAPAPVGCERAYTSHWVICLYSVQTSTVEHACSSWAMHGLSQWNSFANVLRARTNDECHGLGSMAISARCGASSCVCSNRTEYPLNNRTRTTPFHSMSFHYWLTSQPSGHPRRITVNLFPEL